MLFEGDLELQQGSIQDMSLKFTELTKHRIYR